jgi:hypothetical protein
MAVSRILSGPESFRGRMIIYLTRPAEAGRMPDPAVAGPWCDDTRGSTDRLSSLCFVLHRMGFFLPRKLLRER